MDVGSPTIKRFSSLFSKGAPEKRIDVSDSWKTKGPVRNSSIKHFSTFTRLFVPANNVERKREDGCMKKIKIERCMKLRSEDFKNRPKYDIVSGREAPDSVWVDSFGKQARDFGVKTLNTQRISDETHKDHWAKQLNMPTLPNASLIKNNPLF